MFPRFVRMHQAVLLATLALTVSPLAMGQVFDMDKDREPIVSLDGSWRFHPGDDPHWADPGFDDSRWPLIRGDKAWNDQGYEDLTGLAWYRTKVLIPKGQKSLSISLGEILTSYQVFANGKLLGGIGRMPPHERPENVDGTYHVYALPLSASSAEQTISIAIRVWHWPHWTIFLGGGLQGGTRVGQTQLILDRRVARDRELVWRHISYIILTTLETLAGMAAIGFFILRPLEREYVCFGLAMLISAAERSVTFYTTFNTIPLTDSLLLYTVLEMGRETAIIAFYFRLLQGGRGWLFWASMGAIGILPIPLAVIWMQLINVMQWYELFNFAQLQIIVWILVLLIRRAIKGLPDARFLLVPVLFQQLVLLADGIDTFAQDHGWYRASNAWLVSTFQWPFNISLDNIADGFFLVAMLAILVHPFTLTRRQEERFANELEAARVVQSVLIPDEIPRIPGFAIEAIYKPASEVGGDFFQIIATPDGGLLAVIGDVSGKGMPAAMTVSLLVGTVRTLAHYTRDPGEILGAMNQRMLARSQGGFTTCLVLKVDVTGTLTVANAGHLSPYVDAAEMDLESGLPLGLSADSSYPNLTVRLAPGTRLTLLTDGVVEARNSTGELFGFDRARVVSVQSPSAIAEEAKAFGQEDDITVVTVEWTADAEKSVATHGPPILRAATV